MKKSPVWITSPVRKPIASMLSLGLCIGASLTLSACGGGGGGDDVPVAPAAPKITKASCEALVNTVIPGEKIGTLNGNTLKSGDATIKTAVLKEEVSNVKATITSVLDFFGLPQVKTLLYPATPTYCQLNGAIAPASKSDPVTGMVTQPIGFQVNLPVVWNGKFMEFGGSGSNGALKTATGYIDIGTQSGEYVAPLKRGYVTAGTDSGHLTAASAANTSGSPTAKHDAMWDFGLNDEMLRNFAHESYKKVRDLSALLAEKAYGSAPTKFYYFGGSEGGREALTMAQRYPRDFDGVFARAPVIHWTGLFHTFIKTAQDEVFRNAHISMAQVELLYQIGLESCDAADGRKDGVIGNYLACDAMPAVKAKLCKGGEAADTCFTQAQIDGIANIHADLNFPFPLANGVSSYPKWLWGGERATYPAWKVSHKDSQFAYGEPNASRDVMFGFGSAKYFFTRDMALNLSTYDPKDHQAQVQAISALMDSTNPDLSAFHQRGGKAMIVDCTGDWAKSAVASFQYYDAVVAKLGQPKTNEFMRLYVLPSTDHGCGDTMISQGSSVAGDDAWSSTSLTSTARDASGNVIKAPIPVNVDWVTIMENWAEKGVAPGESVVATSNALSYPFARMASRKVCQYPKYPKFTGSNPDDADSYTCVDSK